MKIGRDRSHSTTLPARRCTSRQEATAWKGVGIMHDSVSWYRLLGYAAAKWLADNIPQLGAALAFYAALSLAPLLVLSLRLAALFFEDDHARVAVQAQMHSLMGDQGAAAIAELIAGGVGREEGRTATILSLMMLVFAASGVFTQLQEALNVIWGVQAKSHPSWLSLIRDRLFSFLMVISIAFLLLVSLIISAMVAALGTILNHLPQSMHFVAQLLDVSVSLVVITLLFAAMYKWVPDVKIAWRDVWFGALVTAALFLLGKLAIGFYLGHSALASSYGVAGSFVVLLVWVYYTSQILFFGAELTHVYATSHRHPIAVADNAKRVAHH